MDHPQFRELIRAIEKLTKAVEALNPHPVKEDPKPELPITPIALQ